MTFRIGQKVVCIRDDWRTVLGEVRPVKGCVYTIRSLSVDERGDLFLRLHEIINQPHRYAERSGECEFWSIAFRPVVERKTDISAFERMLTPSNTKVDA